MKKIILALVVLAAVIPFILAAFLFLSRPGAQMIVRVTSQFIPGDLTVETVQGRLADHLVLSGVRYVDHNAAVSLDKIILAWSPVRLLKKECMIRSLGVFGADISVKESDPAENGSASANVNGQVFAFPLPITIKRASVEDVSFSLPGQTEPTRIDTLQLKSARARDSGIRFERAALAAPQYHLEAGGEIEFGEPLAASLSGSFIFRFEGFETIAGKVGVAGTIDKLATDVQFEKPFRAKLSGDIFDPAGEASWQAEFEAVEGHLPQISSDWPGFVFNTFRASGHGSVSTYSLHVDTVAGYERIKGVHLTTQVNGDAEGLVLKETRLSQNNGNLSGNGRLDWRETFSWQAEVTGSDIVLSEVDPTWPRVRLDQADVAGHGIVDTYSLDIKGRVDYGGLKKVGLVTGINGDGNGMQLTGTSLQLLQGSVQGTGKVNWQNGISWQTSLSGTRLNPAAITHQWPGAVDFEVRSDGSYIDSSLAGMLEVVSAKGELRGYPMEAQGTITVDGNNIEIERFSMRSSATDVTFSGSIAEMLDMQYVLQSSDLRSFWPGFSGELYAAGTLSGKRSQPVLDLDLKGKALSLHENSIGEIRGTVRGDLAPGGTIDSSIHASEIIVARQVVETASLAVKGKVEEHNLEAEVNGSDGLIRLTVTGGLTGENWDGTVNTVEIEADRTGNWSLSEPGSIHLSRKEPLTANLCLTGPDSSLVCFTGSADQQAQWQAAADIHSLPFSIVYALPGLSGDEEDNDSVTGVLSLSGTGSTIIGGELDLAGDNFSVRFLSSSDQQQTVSWKKNNLHAVFKDNSLTASLESVLQDDSFLSATATIHDFVPTAPDPEKMTIDGNVAFSFREISPLEFFTFPVAEPYGSVDGRAAVSGLILHPAVTGQVSLNNGRIDLPQLGITLQDLSVNLKGKERSLNLTGICTSGGGMLKIDGVAAFQKDGQESLQVHFSGDRVEVLRLPEWRLKVSPDLKLIVTRQGGDLNGSVLLQEGFFSPHSFAGTVSPSRDVVVVDEKHALKKDNWPFSADVNVVIGDDVRINAFGLQGRLAGNLRVTDQPGKPVVGTGQLSVQEGKFTIYGRELDITTGKLLYSGGAIENPGVAVRAENTTQGIKTGVAVSGFLKEPELSFYSDPPMEENEIIARLLMNTSLVSSNEENEGLIDSVASDTGLDPVSETIQSVKKSLHVDDVRVESGKTGEDLSLVIGSWITPSLYISYGKNLLKESGSFNTKYILGRGFSFETETGSTESGFDFKYEIDR